MTPDPVRLQLAALALAMYLLGCLLPALLRARRAHLQARAQRQDGADWLVAHASQTGAALELAEQSAAALRRGGARVSLRSLGELDLAQLANAARVLFVVSTYGEGDAPDEASAFVTRAMALPAGTAPPLAQLQYAVLALGDCGYHHFCGFGRALDGWLHAAGAQPLAPLLEVDRADPAALRLWQQRVAGWCGAADAQDWAAQPLADWQLAARRWLNPGSAGAPVFHLELTPPAGLAPEWQAGDLAQVAAPGDPDHPRDYSIASLPGDGRLHLLVRLLVHADGTHGVASGWLGIELAEGDTVRLRVRPHRRFRIEANGARPLILIGNGTGLAGLRAHLKARAATADAAPAWLMFGERNRGHDYFYQDEIAEWQRSGWLARVDCAFSRDQAHKRYVQDCVREGAELVRTWVADGAAIYVCGSLDGMADAVDAALAEVLGSDLLGELAAQGRYRRDVY